MVLRAASRVGAHSKTRRHGSAGYASRALFWPLLGKALSEFRFGFAVACHYGKAKMTSVDEAGGVLQNGAVAPDVTATYCFPLTA